MTQQAQVNSDIVVSYVVALHIWFIVCISFIFLALLELAVALLYCQRLQDAKDEAKEEEEKRKESLTDDNAEKNNNNQTVIPVSDIMPGKVIQPQKGEVALEMMSEHQDQPESPPTKQYKLLPLPNGNISNPSKYRRHSYHVTRFAPESSSKEKLTIPDDDPLQPQNHHRRKSHSTLHPRNTAHIIKAILNQVYGQVDWRKSPHVRNKIDYVSRILFPTSFAFFVFFYFFILNYR